MPCSRLRFGRSPPQWHKGMSPVQIRIQETPGFSQRRMRKSPAGLGIAHVYSELHSDHARGAVNIFGLRASPYRSGDASF